MVAGDREGEGEGGGSVVFAVASEEEVEAAELISCRVGPGTKLLECDDVRVGREPALQMWLEREISRMVVLVARATSVYPRGFVVCCCLKADGKATEETLKEETLKKETLTRTPISACVCSS